MIIYIFRLKKHFDFWVMASCEWLCDCVIFLLVEAQFVTYSRSRNIAILRFCCTCFLALSRLLYIRLTSILFVEGSILLTLIQIFVVGKPFDNALQSFIITWQNSATSNLHCRCHASYTLAILGAIGGKDLTNSRKMVVRWKSAVLHNKKKLDKVIGADNSLLSSLFKMLSRWDTSNNCSLSLVSTDAVRKILLIVAVSLRVCHQEWNWLCSNQWLKNSDSEAILIKEQIKWEVAGLIVLAYSCCLVAALRKKSANTNASHC